MKLAVVGGRDFQDYDLLKTTLLKFIRNRHPESSKITIVSGGCPTGADKLAERFAKEHQLATNIFPADWKTHGKAAGPIRNKQIVEASDHIIAFWDGKAEVPNPL